MGVKLININNQNGSILGAKVGFGSAPKIYFNILYSTSFWMTQDKDYSRNDSRVFLSDLWYWMNDDINER